ncbi:MAG: hypothetical protein AAGF12_08075 [Myxococcota bacterium]
MTTSHSCLHWILLCSLVPACAFGTDTTDPGLLNGKLDGFGDASPLLPSATMDVAQKRCPCPPLRTLRLSVAEELKEVIPIGTRFWGSLQTELGDRRAVAFRWDPWAFEYVSDPFGLGGWASDSVYLDLRDELDGEPIRAVYRFALATAEGSYEGELVDPASVELLAPPAVESLHIETEIDPDLVAERAFFRLTADLSSPAAPGDELTVIAQVRRSDAPDTAWYHWGGVPFRYDPRSKKLTEHFIVSPEEEQPNPLAPITIRLTLESLNGTRVQQVYEFQMDGGFVVEGSLTAID